ncbi:MAG TPA: tetratricopeptide repeat protein [Bryobacteraceae bacterium]|nr:tetratricopeptide repeat protein [Bryobacteraceae bacterium]
MIGRKLAFTAAMVLLAAGFGCSRAGRRAQYLAKADELARQQKYEEAVLNYRKALQSDPRFGEAYYKLGLAEKELKHWPEALTALNRAVELMPQNEAAQAQLGNLYLLSYQSSHSQAAYEGVRRIAGRLLAAHANSFDALRLQGYLAAADRNPGQAVEFFSRANAIRPLVPDVVSTLAESLFLTGRQQEGERLAGQLIAAHPEYGPIYDILYSRYIQENRTADAERLLITKAANNPRDELPLLQLAEHYWRHNQREAAERTLNDLLRKDHPFPRPYLSMGDFYRRMGSGDKAIQAYEAGASLEPAGKALYEKRVVESLVLDGKSAQALALVSRLVTEFPSDDDLKGAWATLLVDRDRPEDRAVARRALEELLRKSPDDQTFRYQLARVLAADGKYSDARQQFETVAAKRPDDAMAWLGLAEVSSRMLDFPGTRQAAEKALALNPSLRAARLLRASSLVGLGNLDAARAEYTSLLRNYPAYREAKLQMALLDVVQGRYAEADKAFRANYDPEHGDFRALKGLIEMYFDQGRPNDAFALLDTQIARRPSAEELQEIDAATAARAGKWDLAASRYEKVAALRPNDPGTLLALGDAYRQLGNFEKAGAILSRAASLRPEDWRTPFLLGLVHEAAGQADQAEADYRKCLRMNPDYPEALNNLAFLLAQSGRRLDEAVQLAQKAVHASSGNAAAADTLGWLYLKQGHVQAALQIFGQLAAKRPKDGMVLYHWAVALRQSGQRSAAEKQLKAALFAGLPPAERSAAARLLQAN